MTNIDISQLCIKNNANEPIVWDNISISNFIKGNENKASIKFVDRLVKKSEFYFNCLNFNNLTDEHLRKSKNKILIKSKNVALKERKRVIFLSKVKINSNFFMVHGNDNRKKRFWIFYPNKEEKNISYLKILELLLKFFKNDVVLFPTGTIVHELRRICYQNKSKKFYFRDSGYVNLSMEIYSHGINDIIMYSQNNLKNTKSFTSTHLKKLEEESIYIMREAIAEANKPVMLYSLGKDSSLMLHLAKKAFYPQKPPFPFLHIDTGWKFQAMYDFRDYIKKNEDIELLIYKNPEGVKKKINPFLNNSDLHTSIMKTEALKKAIEKYKFDVAFGGARRDEEKSRSKERIFSFRNEKHQWASNNQRPELWRHFNTLKHKKESIRVFPLSNWTELDVWNYIYKENIKVVPLYFSQERPVILKNNELLLVDDDRMPLYYNDITIKTIRFRTLGCYPLTGAVESDAKDIPSIIKELIKTKTSEREHRIIDSDENSSMETKKEDGYF